MHPSISKFISSTFYDSELSDSNNLMGLIGTPDIYNYYTFNKLVVFHTRGFEEFYRNSYRNEMEVHVVK